MKRAVYLSLLPLLATTWLASQSNPVPTPRAVGTPSSIIVSRIVNFPQAGLSFAPVVTYDAGGFGAYAVAVGDLNGDGNPDLIVADECSVGGVCGNGEVSVLLGNGDGTFQTPVDYSSGGYQTRSVTVADVNMDGKPDLVVTSCCGETGIVGVLLGNGDGTFQTVVTYSSGGSYALTVVVADVNRDGKPDLLVANASGTGGPDGSVGVLLGNGDGTFQTAVNYDSGGSDTNSIAVGDVNGDGNLDLIAVNICSTGSNCTGSVVGIMLGNGDGTFQAAVNNSSGGYGALAVAVGDVNGDGKADLVVANCALNSCNGGDGTAGVLIGNGDGTFQAAVSYDSGGYDTNSVAIADVNGDGKLDLICASNGTVGVVGVLLGNGDGTFQTATVYNSASQEGTGSAAQALFVADVNGDGKPDLLVAGLGETVGVLINETIQLTTTELISSPNPSNFGEAVVFTTTIIGQNGFYHGVPTGTVTIFDGKTSIGKSKLNTSGVASLSISTLAVGSHSITASYNGDTNYAPSRSHVLLQVVQGAIALFSPTSINFGNETVGISNNQGVVATLSNTGNVALNISSIGISGANSSDFSQTNFCGSSIAPGGTCAITVSFTPTTMGIRTAALSVSDNAPNSPQTVSLTGVGVLPSVMISPRRLTFPIQVVFTTSAAQIVTLTNTGLGILGITNISVTGPFAQTNTCGTSIAAGASCTFTVRFRPATIGTLTGIISITDNALRSPQKLMLTGVGTYMQFNPTSLNFGNQPVGTKSAPKRIILSNKGSVAVSVTSISLTGTEGGDFSETNTCGNSVAAGQECFITVTFTPVATGKRTADVSISDNGGGSPQMVSLSGTGTP